MNVERFDIEPQCPETIQRDSLLTPPSYADKYVLTNPPYLALNKARDKRVFRQYNTNDLFKCFLVSLINDPPLGGIVIIPLNFLSSIRVGDIDLRRRFLAEFGILRINVFEEPVFDDTGYTVCAIQFDRSPSDGPIDVHCYPTGDHLRAELTEATNFMMGGAIYHLPSSGQFRVSRLTRVNRDGPHTRIIAKCIDDARGHLLGLSIVAPDQIVIDDTPRLSNRTYATLVVVPDIDDAAQIWLVHEFNNLMHEYRERYHSLMLTNYREGSRKRISFTLVFRLCEYVLNHLPRD